MFAKLKQKLNVEVANPTDVVGDKTVKVHGPGLASPVSVESQSPRFPGTSKETSPVRDATDSTVSSSPMSSQHGQENGNRSDATSKEEVLAMLMKRTDQVKKLETRVSELAAIIRERNKLVEKLEKEQHASDARIEELCSQKDGEAKIRSDLNQAEKQLKKANEELGQCHAELLQTTEQEEMNAEKVKHLDSEVISLLERITQLTVISEQLEEENKHKSKKIEEYEQAQEVLRKTVEEIEEKMALKSSEHSRVEKALTDIQDQYNTLQRNADLHQRKLTALLSEKEDHMGHLQERAQTLEQRLRDGNLSGDDRVTALEKEREALELKLAETREQLTQVKTTWSDKITTLEHQISNLNEKIAEDNEELLLCHTSAEHTKERLQQQVVQLEGHLERSEKEWSAKTGSTDEALRELEKQKHELETELDHEKRRRQESDQEMLEKITTLESQNALLEKGKELAKMTAREKLTCLEQKQEECLEKEIDMERKLTTLEEEIEQLKIDKNRLTEERSQLVDELDVSQQRAKQLSQQVKQLSDELERVKESVTSHKDSLTSVQAELRQCSQDKDTLLLRNAQLFQEVESAKRVQTEVSGELERDGQQKDAAISGLEQQLQELQTEVATHQGQVTYLETQHQLAQGALQSAEVEKLQAGMSALESQLVDKNKTIKQQQQRLNDLKKLLQRELKVQTIPSDQPTATGGTTCATTRTKDILPAVHGFAPQVNELQTSHLVPSLPSQPDAFAVNSSVAQLPNWSHNNAGFGSSMMTSSSLVSSKSALACGSCHRPYCDELDGEEYITDTNFQYLRHVVLKFMLSRETEALQLVKAVSMLLHFTLEEQKLLHETLEWRMSWFGPRPKVGKGKKAKRVPALF